MVTQSIKPQSENLYANIDLLRRLQYKTQGFSFSPNQPANSLLVGKHVSRLRGRGLNFEELRHYQPGDDIRSMDWKVTQRTGKPHIKVFTEERERNVYVVVDQRNSMFFGSTNKMKSVVAAELGALMAWRVTETGDKIGGVIYNDEQTKVVPAKRGRHHVTSLLNELVIKNHQLSPSSSSKKDDKAFNNMLMKLNKIIGHDALILLIGDGYDWDDTSTSLIKKIRQHNEVIAFHVFDPLELTLPEMPQMIVSDGDHQIQFSSQNKEMKEKYQQAIDEQLQSYDKVAKKYRIPLIAIDTITPADKQLRKALGGK